MKFIQLIEYSTSNIGDVEKALDEFLAQTKGKRTGHGHLCADREQANRYMSVVVFDSYEAAMSNNDMPETGAFAAKMMELCDGPPTFRNLDVLRDD